MAVVCSHTDNAPKFVDTFHKFIKILTVNLSQRRHTPWHNLNIISIYLQLITNKIIHNTHNQLQYKYVVRLTNDEHSKNHDSSVHCHLGPLYRLLATSSHLAVPNHDEDGRTVLSSHGEKTLMVNARFYSRSTSLPRSMPLTTLSLVHASTRTLPSAVPSVDE